MPLAMTVAGCLNYQVSPLASASPPGRCPCDRQLDPPRSVHRSGVNTWTPLLHAIHKNQAQAAFALIDAGADPNYTRSETTAPMMAPGNYLSGAPIHYA